ncbi:GntR family transcriptional regulator [Rahnella bruchi]|uniref:GntR family transcriptional regulator n=1 Tax=Rahnella bruchi TaxID=1510573 RepID=UPI001FC90310|nr:GntR family transcriptional regulator [Rahnella bruchi]
MKMKQELDYTRGARPLYAQLYEILLHKLRTGEYKKDDVLPTEAEFEERFGVSRITARRALAELVSKGLLKRQAGIGTMVISTSEKQQVKAGIRLADGHQQLPISRHNLAMESVEPPPTVAAAFGLAPGNQLMRLTRTLYRQNQIPAQLNYIYLTPRLGPLSLEEMDNGLYQLLEERHENIESWQDTITASLADENDCRLLDIPVATALLIKTRKGYNQQQQLVEYTIARHIANCYEYLVEGGR